MARTEDINIDCLNSTVT